MRLALVLWSMCLAASLGFTGRPAAERKAPSKNKTRWSQSRQQARSPRGTVLLARASGGDEDEGATSLPPRAAGRRPASIRSALVGVPSRPALVLRAVLIEQAPGRAPPAAA